MRNAERVCEITGVEGSCPAANYTMVAGALGFKASLQDILKITHGTFGQSYFWRRMLKLGTEIKCISKNDYRKWPELAPPWLADFFAKRSDGGENFQDILANEHFALENRAPTMNDLRELASAGYEVEMMGDGWLIYGDKPKARLLHRVFITGLHSGAVYFHDPALDGHENYPGKPADITKALSVDGTEIVGYKRHRSR